MTTDLPLHPDRPIDFGLQHFCDACKKCARECPSGSITDGPKTMYNGYEIWRNDVDSCARFRVTNSRGASCGRCIKVCPWNKADTLVSRAGHPARRRSGLARRGLIRLDDLMGYGEEDPGLQWWLDMEQSTTGCCPAELTGCQEEVYFKGRKIARQGLASPFSSRSGRQSSSYSPAGTPARAQPSRM